MLKLDKGLVQVNGKDAGEGARIVIVLPAGTPWAETAAAEDFIARIPGLYTGTWTDGTGTITITGYAP